MIQDPIVRDVREAGEELARRANYDLHTFFRNLRNNEKEKTYKALARKKNRITRRQKASSVNSTVTKKLL